VQIKLVQHYREKVKNKKIETTIIKWKKYVIEVTIIAISVGDNGYKGIQNITTYDISIK
jgi:hypothetical protein